jgi:hypothetical protein
MKKLYLLFIPLLFSNCFVFVGNTEQNSKQNQSYSYFSERNKVNGFLDQWHRDVANYDFEAYFGKMSSNSIFIGTDAAENWTLQQFKDFAKPHFDKKKTWDFKALERNVYSNSKGDIVWFDELLETWMGVCRGSGVLSNKNGELKIEHYVLSIVIPNDDVNKVVEIKKNKDTQIIQNFKN